MDSAIVASVISVLGTLVAGLAGYLVGALSRHTEWVNDQKRIEYRQLLDQLYETITVVSENRPGLAVVVPGTPAGDLIKEAVWKLARIFEDRLFIADQLEASGAKKDWYQLKGVIYHEPDAEKPIEFRYSQEHLKQREDELRQKILKLAKNDIVKFKAFGLIPE